MRKLLGGLLLALLVQGCGKPQSAAPLSDEGPLKKLRSGISEGNYEESLKLSKEIASQVPADVHTEEALYLEAYVYAYGKSDFQAARGPLHQLLDSFPKSDFVLAAQKLLADCHYWQGHYRTAQKEYRKIPGLAGGDALLTYSMLQTANCLLLDDKVGEALTAYRELVEKYPTDPNAETAQLLIANTYLKLQNPNQAKTELQKLMALTKNSQLQHSAQNALRQLESEEPFRKGVGVP